MNIVKIVVLVALFFLLSPNILFRLPGNKYISALLHGALFAIIWYVSNPVLEGNSARNRFKQQSAQKDTTKLTADQAKVVQGQAQGAPVQIQKK